MPFELLGRSWVAFRLGREHGGRGVETRAAQQFLEEVVERRTCTRVAHANLSSTRVLEHRGFHSDGGVQKFADGRG